MNRLLIQPTTTITITIMNTNLYRLTLLVISITLLSGCTLYDGMTNNREPQNILSSDDFVSETPIAKINTPIADTPDFIKSQEVRQYKELPDSDEWLFIMDAMVGQVNGQAIYAAISSMKALIMPCEHSPKK